MIPATVTIGGAGKVGDLQPGWSVNEEATPIAIGDSSGAIGTANLSVAHGEDSEFIINEQATLNVPELGDFIGTVSTATSNGATEATDSDIPLGMVDLMAALTSERVAVPTSPPASPVPAGIMESPATIQQSAIFVSHPNDDMSYLYTIGSVNYINRITRAGVETVITLPFTGTVGYGFEIDVSDNYYVSATVAGVPRVYRLSSAGAVLSVWGALGSATGQFAAWTNTVPNNLYYAPVGNRIWVIDYANNRIQGFSPTGTFQLNRLLATPILAYQGDSLMAVDAAQTLWIFDAGTGVPSVVANLTPTTSSPVKPILLTMTASGSWLYVEGGNTSPNAFAYLIPQGTMNANIAPTKVNATRLPANTRYAYYGRTFNGSLETFLHVASNATAFDPMVENLYLVSSTRLRGVFSYYAALGGINTISYQVSTNPSVRTPAWTDSPWNKIKELAAAYNIEVAVINGALTIRDVGTRTLDLENVQGGSVSLSLSNQQTAREVEISYTDPSSTAIGGTFYDAAPEGNVISVTTGQVLNLTFTTDNQLSMVNQIIQIEDPSLASPGTYYVSDGDNVPISVSDWRQAGGQVIASLDSSQPNSVLVSIIAPNGPIVGTNGQYRFANIGTPIFSITGTGLFMSPKTVVLQTGADPAITSTIRASDVRNIFIQNLAQLYDRGIWRAEQLAGPQLELSATVPTSALDGFGLTAGSLVRFKESIYRVNVVRIGRAWTSLTATRRVLQSDVQLVHGGFTMGQVDAFWAGTKYKDQIIKPLRPIV